MRIILHFLSDEDSVKVIKGLLPAMRKDSRILIAESVVPQSKKEIPQLGSVSGTKPNLGGWVAA